jgi:hypothetical protein
MRAVVLREGKWAVCDIADPSPDARQLLLHALSAASPTTTPHRTSSNRGSRNVNQQMYIPGQVIVAVEPSPPMACTSARKAHTRSAGWSARRSHAVVPAATRTARQATRAEFLQ